MLRLQLKEEAAEPIGDDLNKFAMMHTSSRPQPELYLGLVPVFPR